jgi:hypothetical protein
MCICVSPGLCVQSIESLFGSPVLCGITKTVIESAVKLNVECFFDLAHIATGRQFRQSTGHFVFHGRRFFFLLQRGYVEALPEQLGYG